jgi:hypothetical protein
VNEFLATRFVENVQRLALGLEPVDAVRRARIPHPIHVVVEGKPFTDPLAQPARLYLENLRDQGLELSDVMLPIPRHPSCRHALLFEPPAKEHVDVRFFERQQRFVPRRLRFPLPAVANPADATLWDGIPVSQRSRRPGLFPGAAYDVTDSATGLRGRVVRPDPLDALKRIRVRWPRVVAKQNGAIVGRAHGDQNGEFVLLLAPEAVPGVELAIPLQLEVTAFGPPPPPPPPPPPLPPAIVRQVDPLWDVPLELAAAPGVTPDSVTAGEVVPTNYTDSATRTVVFTYGALISSGIPPFELT